MKFITIGPENVESSATEVLVRMRDGVRLATDVYLPDGWTTGPTVLVRLPYDKRSSYVYFTRAAKLFNERGYALVVQDVRGKFKSGGETLAFLNETNDGYDTIEWVINQAWSDGKVAMFGDSYYGFTQWAAVASEHPALRAIVPRVTSANLGNRGQRANNDGKTLRLATLWQAKYLAEVWASNEMFEPEWDERPLDPTGMFEEYFADIGHRSSYFDITRVLHNPPRVFPGKHPFDVKPLPVLHVAGWFDNLKTVSFDDYRHLSRRPGWDALQYLWVDSMDHEGYRLPDAPIRAHDDHIENEAALVRHLERYVNPALDFFDVFVKETKDSSTIPRVRWHLSNSDPDVMYRSEAWPPEGGSEYRLSLGDADRSLQSAEGGSLHTGKADHSVCQWIHDPTNPVPAPVENMFAILTEYPDHTPISGRPDVPTFTSDPLAEDTNFVGSASVTLHVSSSSPKSAIVCKLLDVSPSGESRLVAWGDAEFDAPEAGLHFTIDLGEIAYRFRAGHAIRLQLSGSEYPTYFVNPGTGETAWDAREHRSVSLRLTAIEGVGLKLRRLEATTYLNPETEEGS